MSGLNSIMDTSLSALFAAQAGLETTGHNIANSSTPGYSRQRVMYSPKQPQYTTYGAIGRGINIDGITRIQDEFLSASMRTQAARLSSYTTVDSTLYEIEAIFGSVDNDHLGDSITKFFNSWNGLAQPPINANLKQDVVLSAESLVTDFHAMDQSLTTMEENLNDSIASELDNLNNLLVSVASINDQIMRSEVSGQPANDLRDQRDLIVLEISELAEVSVIEREDGSKDIIMGGRTLVTRDSVTVFGSVRVQDGDNSSRMMIVIEGSRNEVALSPGRIAGLVDSRDVYVREVREQLDAVARKLIEEVNALHTQGRTATSSGQAFFTGDNIHTIGVNQALLDDPALVATGRTLAESDNELALAIAALANTGQNDVSIGDSYRSVLVSVASNRAGMDFMVDNQQNMVTSLQAKIASVSGVSLDEEGANMVKYQNAYNAAARIITTVQEMYDALLNMV